LIGSPIGFQWERNTASLGTQWESGGATVSG
jgi:hypothetical protein